LIVGFALDASGGMSPGGWAIAYGLVAACVLIAVVLFTLMRPRELAGDRHA
jgi:hypothetical protein